MTLPDPRIGEYGWDQDRESVQRNFDAQTKRFPLECSSDNFQRVPHARVSHSTNQSAANVTATLLAFDTERWDYGTPSSNMHDTSTNSGRFTIRVPGLYVVTLHVRWAVNATGFRLVRLKVGGTTEIANDTRPAVSGDVTLQTVSTEYRFDVDDYVEAIVFQNSGGALNVESVSQMSPEFMLHWVGP